MAYDAPCGWVGAGVRECWPLILATGFDFRDVAAVVWVIMLAWNGLILWYFLRPSVKAQFVTGGKSSNSRTDG
jgi:hypothetical protein